MRGCAPSSTMGMDMRAGLALLAVAIGVGHPGRVFAQQVVDLGAVPGGAEWRVDRRPVTVIREDGRVVLRFSEGPGDALAWSPALRFTDGDIEFDARGRDVQQKSFLGVVFHVADDTTWDVVWLRPFNFQGVDSAHHAHAVQAASYPRYTWQRLRADYPGRFEAALSPVPDPNAWVHVRVSVSGAHVGVFINRAATPALEVDMPSGLRDGGIGLWVGNGSNGDFGTLTLRRR